MLRMMSVTALALAVLASNAMAQQGGGKSMGSQMNKYDPPPENKPLYNERDYKAASDRIPSAQVSNDPWAGAREATPGPAAASTPNTAKQSKKKP